MDFKDGVEPRQWLVSGPDGALLASKRLADRIAAVPDEEARETLVEYLWVGLTRLVEPERRRLEAAALPGHASAASAQLTMRIGLAPLDGRPAYDLGFARAIYARVGRPAKWLLLVEAEDEDYWYARLGVRHELN